MSVDINKLFAVVMPQAQAYVDALLVVLAAQKNLTAATAAQTQAQAALGAAQAHFTVVKSAFEVAVEAGVSS
jgi:hypothetical protein